MKVSILYRKKTYFGNQSELLRLTAIREKALACHLRPFTFVSFEQLTNVVDFLQVFESPYVTCTFVRTTVITLSINRIKNSVNALRKGRT